MDKRRCSGEFDFGMYNNETTNNGALVLDPSLAIEELFGDGM